MEEKAGKLILSTIIEISRTDKTLAVGKYELIKEPKLGPREEFL